MIFFLIILLISIAGLALLFIKRFLVFKTVSKEEIFSRYNSAKPFWSEFRELFVVPTIRVHQEKVRPATYKEIEKMARRFRISVLKIECLLTRFTDYIRGKRVMSINGNKCGCANKSSYWEQLNNCKNGTHNQEGNTPP
jgi:hypothetical protein